MPTLPFPFPRLDIKAIQAKELWFLGINGKRFLNMGNGCTKRSAAGLNIVHDATVQARLRKREGNKSHSYGRKLLAASRRMPKELSV